MKSVIGSKQQPLISKTHEVIFVLLVTAVGNDFLDFCKAPNKS